MANRIRKNKGGKDGFHTLEIPRIATVFLGFPGFPWHYQDFQLSEKNGILVDSKSTKNAVNTVGIRRILCGILRIVGIQWESRESKRCLFVL